MSYFHNLNISKTGTQQENKTIWKHAITEEYGQYSPCMCHVGLYHFILCELWFSKKPIFLSQASPKLLHRTSSPDCCQSSWALRAPAESHTHFNIYWNVIKTTQGDSRQSMLFRLSAAEAGLLTPTVIVCLHAIHPHPSEETTGESHLRNSGLGGGDQRRLDTDWQQCVLIDWGCILVMGEKCRNMLEGYTGGFSSFIFSTIISQYRARILVPAAIWMITAPAKARNLLTDLNKL